MPFRRQQIPWLAMLGGAVASIGTWAYFQRLEDAALHAEIARRSQTVANVIAINLRAHEMALYSLRNLFHFSESVSRAEFAGASDELIARYPGIQALEWAKRTPAALRAPLEAAIRAEGFPEFEILDRVSRPSRLRSPERPEHFPVVYVHPFDPNRAALGYDMASGSIWENLVGTARDNTLFVSGRLPLITDGNSLHWGYLLALPVYLQPLPATPEARLAALDGYVVGIFRTSDIIANSIGQLAPQGIDVMVLDPSASDAQRMLHYSPSRLRQEPGPTPALDEFRASRYATGIPLVLPGRTWEILCRPSPAWLAANRSLQPFVILAVGLLSSALLGVYLRGTLRHADAVEREVEIRTAELRQTQELLEQDILHRTEVERALQASESRLQAIIDHNPSVVFVKDLEGRYLLANRPFEARCGRPLAAIAGRTDFDLFPRDWAERFRETDRRVLASGQPLQFEEEADLNGRKTTHLVQKFPLRDATGRAYALCGISTDITDRIAAEQNRLRLERQLLEAKKLESLGVLAGGIAHDFNNILTSVLGNASLTRAQLDPAHPAQAQIWQIEIAARRAADLCAQMLAYAGKGTFVTATLDVSALVRDTAALLKVSAPKGTRLHLELAPNLPGVLGDATQLRQVVMNLVLNAADAIGQRADGVITIATYARAVAPDLFRAAVQAPELPGGDYLAIEVADNGSGMPPEILARIFEPFFTTKFSGRGLGLAAVLGIVQGHRGALFVESATGHGTTFRLLLPALPAPAAPVPAAPKTEDRRPLHGTVLLVDDEADVRLIAARVLGQFGVTPLVAENGDEALAVCAERGEAIDLVLLDLTMPGRSGEETLREIRRRGLAVKVLIMSGYSETETRARCASLDVAGFLPKPFEVDQLLAIIRPFLH